MQLLIQMSELLLLMAIGYFLGKRKMLDDHSAGKLTAIVVNVANPCVILNACIGQEREEPEKLLITVLVALLSYVYLIVLAELMPVLFHVPKGEKGTYKVMTIFSNIGFMGLPVIAAVYGSQATLYASIFLFPYNVLIYTLAVHMLQQDAAPGSTGTSDTSENVETGHKNGQKAAGPGDGRTAPTTGRRRMGTALKEIFNVGLISAIIGIIIYLAQIPVIQPISETIRYLSNLTAPLSMMLIGYSMTGFHFRDFIADRRLLIYIVVRQLAVPLIAMLVIMHFVTDPDLLGVTFIMLATPIGSMTAMMAQLYGGNEKLASKGVALSTVLSVATIPLLSLILRI